MRLPLTRRRGGFDVTMTPMIDVVFQLLIFFVCTASFQPAEELMPSSVAAETGSGDSRLENPETVDLERIVIRVGTRGGRLAWLVNDQPFARLADVHARLAGLARGLARLGTSLGELPVILEIEPEIMLGDVIDVVDVGRALGLKNVRFAAVASADR
ncbi:MAG: biopolymer transporter ExbD [Pirellulales bacterium]